MKKALVIVESPAKARTISKFLGPNYQVEASMGHIRDLPSTASEIPANVKEQPWARIGVDVDHGFKPLYIVPDTKKQHVKKLKSLAKDADELFLATDEDREGEAIAWHLLEVLEPDVPVKRMVFHEITKTAIEDALSHTRTLDQKLVDAQEARRILDRLYGYEVSPVLWRKVQSGLSAGRVQSVAVRLVVDRERARMRFVRASYWDVDGILEARTENKDRVNAHLVDLAGKRVATGKDFDPQTGKLQGEAVLLDETRAKRLAKALEGKPFTVAQVTEKPFTQRPYPPFITSTLQQEAARKLRLTAQRTMRIAQSLYENGYITYMRTDSTNLSQQAITAARNLVTDLYGKQYLPDEPRTYAKKVKGAQEAHEAIRPAGEVFRTPEQLKAELDEDQLKLYDLIWKRTVASQMKDASGQRTSVQLKADGGPDGQATFTASGKVITFPGFLRAYVEGSDDPDAEIEDQERVLPPMKEGQQLDARTLEAKGHETQPPARFTEASLIKELEDRGIGRPSTYASIIQTIQDREYVFKKGTALVPTFTAFAVTNLLERHFGELVDYDFTAHMEQDLDSIASGERESAPWLRDFYFGKPAGESDLFGVGLKKRIGSGWEEIDPRGISTIPLGHNDEGQPVHVRVGRYGPYIQVGEDGLRANVPADVPPDELSAPVVKELLARAAQGDRVVGQDPDSGKPIYVKNGRFGPYVQLGDMEEPPSDGKKKKKTAAPKPKMASLWPGMTPDGLTLEQALTLLSFPKSLGKHPEKGEEITAQDGRFGPYLKMGTDTRSLNGHEHLASVTLDEAVKIFEQPKQGRARGGQKTLAEVGAHPKSGVPMKVMNGRFGAYVSDGVVNASLPKGADPTKLTVEQAVELLDAREAKLREMGKDPRAAKAAKGARGAAKKAAGTKAAGGKKKAAAAEEGEAVVAPPPKKKAAGGKSATK